MPPDTAAVTPPRSLANRTIIREKQPAGRDGATYSLSKMVGAIRTGRTDPTVVAWARRMQRDAGYPSDVVGQARAVFDGMRKQNIRWVSDPVRAEFIAAVRDFAPSELGADDAFMVSADCEELTSVVAGCFLAGLQAAANIEQVAILGHAYDAGKNVSHVLAAFHDGKGWFRVDPSGEGDFGWFKKPTHEILISVPSGSILCSAENCMTAQPVRDSTPVEHVRLEGLPENADAAAVLGSLHSLSDMAQGDDEGDRQAGAIFGDIIAGQQSDLVVAAEDYAAARTRLTTLFDVLGFSGAERDERWPVARDALADETLSASDLLVRALQDVLDGRRRWAIDDKTGDYVVELLPTDGQRLTDSGQLVSVLQGLPREPLPDTSTLGAVPLPPVVIALLIVAGVVVAVGGYYTIVESLRSLTKLAEELEIAEANKALAKCAENYEPDRCAKLGMQIANVRSSKAEAEAKGERARADAAAAQARLAGYALVGVGLVAAGGVGWYTGALPAALASARAFFARRRGG